MSLGTENETTEFVDSMDEMAEGLRSMAAMLNRYHRADVYIGVGADGEPNGADIEDSDLDVIRESMASKMNTVPEASITIVTDESGRRYIHIFATGYDIPYTYDGWFRIRRCCVTRTNGTISTEWKNLMTCGMKRHRIDMPCGRYDYNANFHVNRRVISTP